MKNPYTLSFGKKPTEYINRIESTQEIKSAFLENPAKSQTYLIRGVRGSGKTVLMTAVAKEISKNSEWICVDLNSTLDLLSDLSYRLLDACESLSDFFDRGIDISAFGIGVGFGGKENRDNVSRCEKILEVIKKQKKKLLITVDEVSNDQSMKTFVSQFQIWMRKDYPIYLLMTGLYENIYAIQNDPKLTFLLRSPKITLGPLSILQIARQYESVLDICEETALKLAKETKGYAFAFQALGMLYFDDKGISDIDILLSKMDNYLDEFVYQKIWSMLSDQDKRVILALSDSKSIKVKEICEKIGMTSSTFSKYRERLINKGLINANQHGYIELTLPRFRRICGYYL